MFKKILISNILLICLCSCSDDDRQATLPEVPAVVPPAEVVPDEPTEESTPGEAVVSETNGDKKHVVAPDGDNQAYLARCDGGGEWGARESESYAAVCIDPVIELVTVDDVDWMENKKTTLFSSHERHFARQADPRDDAFIPIYQENYHEQYYEHAEISEHVSELLKVIYYKFLGT